MDSVWSVRGERIVISRDDHDPDVLHLDRDAPTVLVPIDGDRYAIFRGRVRLGDIVFHDGDQQWGWRYHPRGNDRQRPSRKLHPDAWTAIRRRVRVDTIIPPTEITNRDTRI